MLLSEERPPHRRLVMIQSITVIFSARQIFIHVLTIFYVQVLSIIMAPESRQQAIPVRATFYQSMAVLLTISSRECRF